MKGRRPRLGLQQWDSECAGGWMHGMPPQPGHQNVSPPGMLFPPMNPPPFSLMRCNPPHPPPPRLLHLIPPPPPPQHLLHWGMQSAIPQHQRFYNGPGMPGPDVFHNVQPGNPAHCQEIQASYPPGGMASTAGAKISSTPSTSSPSGCTFYLPGDASCSPSPCSSFNHSSPLSSPPAYSTVSSFFSHPPPLSPSSSAAVPSFFPYPPPLSPPSSSPPSPFRSPIRPTASTFESHLNLVFADSDDGHDYPFLERRDKSGPYSLVGLRTARDRLQHVCRRPMNYDQVSDVLFFWESVADKNRAAKSSRAASNSVRAKLQVDPKRRRQSSRSEECQTGRNGRRRNPNSSSSTHLPPVQREPPPKWSCYPLDSLLSHRHTPWG